jgi:hypothetical protein
MRRPALISAQRAERRAAPKPGNANRGTRLALRPSMLAQASMEPRAALPSGDRPMYSSDEGLS